VSSTPGVGPTLRSTTADRRPRATTTAMRETEISNAVSFLTHASVRASRDDDAKRGFLKGKGVREDEIDEAFRRAGREEGVGGGGAMAEREERRGTAWGGAARLAAVVGAAYLAYPSARRWLARFVEATARGGDAKDDAEGSEDARTPARMNGVVAEEGAMTLTPELAGKIERAVERVERAEERAEALREEIKNEVSSTVRDSITDVKTFLETQMKAELAELKQMYAAGGTASGVSSPAARASKDWPFKTSPQGSESGESLAFTPEPASSAGEFTLNTAPRPQTSASENPNFFSAQQTQRRPGRDQLIDPPHPSNFMDILEMLENGKTPPGIKDIDDTPPNPDAAIPRSSASRPGKPWQSPESGANGKALEFADDEVTQVPIRRVNAEGSAESPWKPPPAPELSKLMSVTTTVGSQSSETPRSPRRSVEHDADRFTREASTARSPSAKLAI
tara:strand:- start:8147 stop:9499 length:1353 start_codon:yes stop_codon:yes gene_type:complete